MFIVFDLDDTLADTTHRQHILEQKGFTSESEKWNAFFEACDKDSPKTEIIELLDLLDFASHRVEIWTGRSNRVRDKTEAWLEKHLNNFEDCELRMRADGDYRPDTEVKADWIKQYGKPDLVFDDRNKVVTWWREQGITCCQVKESDF